ncbi:selenium metabolism-associated LysR family transcriptional regulator [Tepidibacillus marianensis]|uniref:selenium metabolism-associated LysR family transcriptional regulator n=1 Tax=Tepidibacillus marianensis TaxID=3131995 RepID=UPI0030CF818E
MNFRRLHIFKIVCESETLTEAGKKLYMTQPAISQAISELESELNTPLFERINKKLLLTYAGEVLYQYSKRILNLIDEARTTIDDITNRNRGRLRIGASTTIGTYLLPHIIGQFQKKYPTVDLPFVIDNTEVIEGLIQDHQIDIGLVEGPIHSKVQAKPFYDDELYFICSPEHRWANKGTIEPHELESESLIMREKGSGTREVFENVMNEHNQTYQVKHVLNNTEAIKKSVEANIGVAIISKIAVIDEMQAGKVVNVQLNGIRFVRKLHFIYHQEKYPSQLFQEFIDTVKECRPES